MGLYDHIVDYRLECPFCGDSHHLEIQTKDLDCSMMTYSVHYDGEVIMCKFMEEPKVSDKLKYIECSAACSSPECFSISRMRDLMERGYISGFGRRFDLEYDVKDQKLIGPARLKHDDKETFEEVKMGFHEYLKNDARMKVEFNKVLNKYCGEYGIAVLHFNYKIEE
jgi:hypothetical protein